MTGAVTPATPKGSAARRLARGLTGPVTVLLTAIAACVIPLAPAAATAIGTRVPVPDISVSAMAVSEDYEFVAQRGDDEVVVFDDDLQHLGSLTDIPNVQGLLVHDTTLYVSAYGAHRIDVFDLTQPFPFARTSFPTAPVREPSGLAWAGGQLWFRGESETASAPSLHSMSQTGVVSVHDGAFSEGFLETSPGRPNDIIVVGYTQIARYLVAGGSPSLVASAPLGANVVWADWSPDGSELVVGHGGGSMPAGSWAFDADTLDQLHRFGGVGQGGAVTADSNRVLVVTVPASESFTELRIHRMSDGAELSVQRLSGARARDDSVEMDPDGSRFFMFGSNLYGSQLQAFPFDPQPASMTLDAPRSVRFGENADVVVELESASGNRDVRIYTRIKGRERELVAEGTVGNGGLDVTLRDLRATTTVIAEWDGDDTHLPITALKRVGVEPIVKIALVGGFANDGAYRLYHAGDDPAVVVDVTPNLRGTFAQFDLQKFVNGRWRMADTLGNPLDRRSRAAVVVVNPAVGVRYRINSEIDPSDKTLGSTTRWLYFRLV